MRKGRGRGISAKHGLTYHESLHWKTADALRPRVSREPSILRDCLTPFPCQIRSTAYE